MAVLGDILSMTKGKGGSKSSSSDVEDSNQRKSVVEELMSFRKDRKVPSYKRGGRVRKTGLAKVHKGEYVIPVHSKRKGKRGGKRR